MIGNATEMTDAPDERNGRGSSPRRRQPGPGVQPGKQAPDGLPGRGELLEPGGEIDDADEAGLVALVDATRAGDPAARNELFRLFGPRIDRWVRREWAFMRRQANGLEQGDLQSEAFLVLTDLIDGWPGEGRFGVYVVHVFPLRLRAAARRAAGLPVRRRAGSAAGHGGLDVPWTADDFREGGGLAADESWEAEQTTILLETIASRLPDERGQQILLWRVRDGQSLSQIARSLGLSRRQVYRIWNDITAWARDHWAA